MKKYLLKGILFGALFAILIVPPALFIDYPANKIFTIFWQPAAEVAEYFTYDVFGVKGSDLAGAEIYIPILFFTHFFLYCSLGILVAMIFHKLKSRRG